MCSHSYLAVEEWLPEIPYCSNLWDSILQLLSFKITQRCFSHLLSTFLRLKVFNSPLSSLVSSSNYSSISVPFIILLFCWYCCPTFKSPSSDRPLWKTCTIFKNECPLPTLLDSKLRLLITFLLHMIIKLSSDFLLDMHNRLLQTILNILSIYFLLAYIL